MSSVKGLDKVIAKLNRNFTGTKVMQHFADDVVNSLQQNSNGHRETGKMHDSFKATKSKTGLHVSGIDYSKDVNDGTRTQEPAHFVEKMEQEMPKKIQEAYEGYTQDMYNKNKFPKNANEDDDNGGVA